jgi:hypothetical protein
MAGSTYGMLNHGSDAVELATVLNATTTVNTDKTPFSKVSAGSVTI